DASLGPNAEIAIEAGSTRCRSGSATPSVTNPRRFPFPGSVSGRATAAGVQTGFTLGFVVFNLHGRCWKATNERIAAAASGPVVLTRRERFPAAASGAARPPPPGGARAGHRDRRLRGRLGRGSGGRGQRRARREQ